MIPDLTCRKAVNLSVTRAMAANEPNVRKWFAEYEQVLYDLHINSPEQIWSGDETGVQNVPKEEVVACVKGKLSYQTVAADQGETSTIPWTRDAPVGVRITVTSKGYITKQKFHEYSAHFVRYLKTHRILHRPHLLIVDSHKSHMYNVAFFDERNEFTCHGYTPTY